VREEVATMGNQVTEMTGTGSDTRPAYAPLAAVRPATEPRYRGTILAPVARLRSRGEVCPSTGGFPAGPSTDEVGGTRVVAGMPPFQGTGVPVARIERDHALRVTAARSYAFGVGVKPFPGDQSVLARLVPPVPGSTHERPPA
jgi:hypothetical protein